MTEKLSHLLRTYSLNHQNKTNKKIHRLAVPLIMFSLLGLLSQIQWTNPLPPEMDRMAAADIAIIAALIYYAQFKSLKAYVVIMVQLVPMVLIIAFIPPNSWFIYLFIFVVGWIAQFIGHKIEGKSPSFFTDVQFLLIGPLWIWDLEKKT